MRVKGTDRKAIEKLVAGSAELADYARLYPDTHRRAVELVTGLSADYAETGFTVWFETSEDAATRATRLSAAFDLTPSEAAVAIHIGGGGKLGDFAAAKGLSRNTARNQLQQVFEKTGVRRQAELVALLKDF